MTDKRTLNPEDDLTLPVTMTVREWAYAAGVLGSAVDMAMQAGKNAGGMPDDIAHVTAAAEKLRTSILNHELLGGIKILAEEEGS
jgi:hypothetical protein